MRIRLVGRESPDVNKEKIMAKASGWNMHSVIDVAPVTETDAKIASALDVLGTFAPEWLDHSTMSFSVLRAITTSPRVELRHLRELADRLGFLIMPFAYLDPRSYANETAEMQRAIHGFAELAHKFQIYVLCPLEYYSLSKHIETTVDLPIHVPPEFVQTFLALDMCLPVFRGLKRDIAELRSQLEMNLRARQERERVRLLDPMMIAVAKDVGIKGNGLAQIGPAWGPDIEEALLERFKLTTKPEQRKMIEASINRSFGHQTRAGAMPLLDRYHVHMDYAPLPDWSALKKEFGVVSELFDGSRPWKTSTENATRRRENVLILKEFAEPIKSRPVINWASRNGYRPASHEELIEFVRAHPGLERQFMIVALGSYVNRTSTVNGRYNFLTTYRERFVAVMSVRARVRGMYAEEYASSWANTCRFLLVQQ